MNNIDPIAPNPAAHTLDVAALTKTYGDGHMAVTAVDGATFHVAQNEFIALLGPSGSGKTTLLSMVGGLLTPTDGAIMVDGENLGSMSKKEQARFRANRIGFVFQSFNLVPFLTARENLTVMSSIADASKKEIEARADQLLEELGLAKRRNNLPEQLSGGERQRVAIGRALVTDPELILVDEPTASLDTELGRAVVQLLSSEVKKRGKAGIMVTHDLRMVEYTDRTLHIVDGRLGLHDESAEDEMVS
jgi:putative ABC transport system ATP-binding protein